MFGFFPKNQKLLAEIERQREKKRLKLERDVCASVARGNVSLQHGEYITQEDMDSLQNKMEKYFFSEQSKW